MAGYTGLIKKYPVNRLLTKQDRKYHLAQGERLDLSPYPDIVIVKVNSTYLEVVDKYFQGKGLLSLMVLAFSTMVFGFGAAFFISSMNPPAHIRSPGEYVAFGVVAGAVLFSFGLGLIWFGRVEWRGYTHYPIRLNHKTQMVHVFRKDGSVLSVPWADLYFTLDYDFSYFRFWHIHGHVLAEDRETVLETFALGMSGDVDPVGLQLLHRHWEFFRRYMAEGPESVASYVRNAMPVDGKRESFRSGYEVIMSELRHDHPIADAIRFVLWPFFFLQSLVRWVVMRTSKMPRWPEEIEAVNKVSPNDPYDIDSRINPPELR
ncbi:DUF6708 domain-containing protein [Luteimonas qiangzhengi]|uniref:DUF6708 domain-containing protein n=1 Tax=Luteimonas sp. MJ146 TaxID=3129240 RepID=UPI0031BA810D